MKAQSILTLAFLALSLSLPTWAMAQQPLTFDKGDDSECRCCNEFNERIEYFIEDFSYSIYELSKLDELKNPDQITAIEIQNDQIKTLPSGLSRFPNLRKLIIYSAQLNDLTGIEQLSKLEYLDLDGCRSLEILPVGLAKLPHLRVLNLSNTAVRTPMEVLSQLKKLEKLSFQNNNNLQNIEGIGNLTTLRHLELGIRRSYLVLPNELAKLTNLKYLEIQLDYFFFHYDDLKNILASLVNLEHLSLFSFEKIPIEGLLNLPKLECLELFSSDKTSHDVLIKFPKLKKLLLASTKTQPLILSGWLDKMQNLEELELINVLVDDASAPLFGKLNKLKKLTISNARINTFPSLPVNLKSLSLSHSDSVFTISNKIGKYIQLEELSISNLPITFIPKEIGNLSNLKVLSLGFLELTSIPKEIGQLKKLRDLSLSTNKLSSLPAEITNLPELVHFNVLGNENLKELPAACWKHPKLHTLSINRTAISQIPAEVSKNKYDNYRKKLRIHCSQTPLASQAEQLSKTFPNLEISAE
jgi:Leucine-rich repeat (LRR) protein